MGDFADIVVLDTETTGLSTLRGGRVIEIAALRVRGDRIVSLFHTLINPGTPILAAAIRVHGITPATLRGAPHPDQVWPHFRRFIGDSPLVAHNAPFDRSFILHELTLCGYPLHNHWHCTLRRSRRELPHLPDHRLETVATHLLGGIPPTLRLHRALDDARLTAAVWLALQRRSGNRQDG